MTWSAFVSAILGAVLTQVVTVGLAIRRERIARSYLVAKISIQLEAFASACGDISADWGQPATHESGEETWTPIFAQLPDVSFDREVVDWTVIPHGTLVDVLRLPVRASASRRVVANAEEYDDDPHMHREVFHARQTEYGALGLSALDLADRLRSLIHISNISAEALQLRTRILDALHYTESKHGEWREARRPGVRGPLD